MNSSHLNDFYRDAFQELGNIGSGNAATALSQLVGRTIDMSVPEVLLIPIEQVPDIVGDMEKTVAGIYLEVYGDVPSKILVTFPHENLLSLTDLMMNQPIGTGSMLDEIKLSALKELGTILSGAYLNAMSKFLDLRMIPSVPALAIDSFTAVLNTILAELSQENQCALLLRTEIMETENKISGSFFLIPEKDALETIISAIQKASGVVNVGEN
ncbi:chemotaxis protein CheC [bacterium]|nr:chemotaxis protein CheC [bacterium]